MSNTNNYLFLMKKTQLEKFSHDFLLHTSASDIIWKCPFIFINYCLWKKSKPILSCGFINIAFLYTEQFLSSFFSLSFVGDISSGVGEKKSVFGLQFLCLSFCIIILLFSVKNSDLKWSKWNGIQGMLVKELFRPKL